MTVARTCAPGRATPRVLVVAVESDSALRAARLAASLTSEIGLDSKGWRHLADLARAVDRDSVDMILIADAGSGAQCAAVRVLKRMPDPLPVLVEAADLPGPAITDLVRAGADGLVPRGGPPEVIARCIEAALGGEVVLPRSAVRHLALEMRLASLRVDRTNARLRCLSRREREVLTLLWAGLATVEVANRLFVTPETVRFHVHNALRKLRLRSREDAFRLIDEPEQTTLAG